MTCPRTCTRATVSYITTSSQEGAYLAGILAAKMTKTKKVGIVISAADDNWYKMSGGFVQGFKSVNKTDKIYFADHQPDRLRRRRPAASASPPA